jgi:hypothetical protein
MGSSFNAYVRELVKRDTEPKSDLAKEMFAFMEEHPPRFPDAKWTRGEIHEHDCRKVKVGKVFIDSNISTTGNPSGA